MENFNPLVSIIIPVYNGSNYLKEAIDSALEQTYKNIEIIVVNDGSTDGGKTERIAKAYKDKIRYFSKDNGGVATALNYGIEKMEGEYFSWLSHDDLYYPDKVAKQVALLGGQKDKRTVIYSGLEIIDGVGRHIETQDYAKKYSEVDLNRPLFAFFHLALNGCSMLIHKSHFQRVGMFDAKLPTTQDYDLWFRLLRGSNIVYADHILVKSRSHEKQGSKAFLDDHVKECNAFWLRVFSSLREDEIIETGGSKEHFYADLYNSFRSLTGYGEVITYLYGKLLEAFVHEFHNEENPENRNSIVKTITREICGGPERSTGIVPQLLNYGKKEKTRVIFFASNWHDRGGITRVISIVSSLLSPHYEVSVWCMKEDGNESGYRLDPRVEYLELELSEFSLMPSLLKVLDADIFIGSNNCFVPLINMYKEIEHLGIKVIMWNHEHYFVPHFEDNLNETVLVRDQVFKDVSAVLWLTKCGARLGRLHGDRVGVMKNPLSFSLSREYEKKETNSNIISIARFDSPRKRLDRLIHVFAEVIKRKPDTKLYVVGQYDLSMQAQGVRKETISELIGRLKVPSESIIFVGETRNVERYYSKATVNVMTSEREGFGLTVIESALFGVPSVVFGGGGMGDIISSGENGFVVEDNNIEEMAEKIVSLLTDRMLYSRMSESARRLANDYREETILNNWMRLLDAVRNLNREDLSEFLRKNFSVGEDNVSLQEFKDVVRQYEEVVKDQMGKVFAKSQQLEEMNKNQGIMMYAKSYLYRKIAKLLGNFQRVVESIRIHGLRITARKIVLKIIRRVPSSR